MMNRAFYADENKQPSPNFVVIVTDDQSWVGSSVLMAPGDRRTRGDYYQTPHIGRLAMMGMRFTQGYSPAPFCCPTRRSLLIGQTLARHIYQKDQENIEQREREVERASLDVPKAIPNLADGLDRVPSIRENGLFSGCMVATMLRNLF
jgi:arylsulfatase A-like enzyme